MRHLLSIAAAAAAVVAGLIRMAIGNGDGTSARMEYEGASEIPRMTPALIERLAYNGATDTEIADRFLVDEATLKRECANVLRVARALRHMTLRGLQFDLARKLNGPSLIWLGRNELGQSLNPATPDDEMPETSDEEFE